ncbi:MAG TPA: hypothetical protein VK420_14940 [Longimicrobium sp.]|nr:hypothetical protein [Longimicrobium sp.]
MMEDRPITDLPDLSDLPPDVQEFIRGLAEDGIEVTPGRPGSIRSRPELRLNACLTDAASEELKLPDLSDLPPDAQEFIRGLAQDGIEVTPGRPNPNRILPEPLRANTSLSAAVIEEREEYDW